MVMVFDIGASAGPGIGAAMMDVFGPDAFFWSMAAFQAAVGVFALWRMTQRASKPLDEQGAYVAVSARATAVAQASLVEAELLDGEEATAEAGPEELSQDAATDPT